MMTDSAPKNHPELSAYLQAGGIVILTGDALRGGDIDFAMAASKVTPEKINFMAKYGRGLICLAITAERAWKLGISAQNTGDDRRSGRPFGCSIEAKHDVDTGISAHDRATTIAVAVAAGASANDIVTPGHIFPLIAEPGGLADRHSTLEASIELFRRHDLGDAAVLCSIMRADGEMARVEDVMSFAREHEIPMIDISEIADGQ